MKKIISLLLSAVMLLSVTAGLDLTAFATTSGDYEYTVSNGTAEITGYTGSETELTIPSAIDGYTVTSIDYAAFRNCTSLTEITIPESVTSIGSRAFDSCTSLTNVTIGNGVTSIGDYAFDCCYSLVNIIVDSNNANYSSQDGVLFDKDKTELIQYPVGNTRTAYTVPDSVISISDNAFYNCKSLLSIIVPDSVTSIGWSAFAFCDNLTNVILSDNITKINFYLFKYCTSLENITIPSNVTDIFEGAFYNCTSLTSVIIPESVTEIREDAFKACTSLTDITILNPDCVIFNGYYNDEGIIYDGEFTISDTATIYGYENSTAQAYAEKYNRNFVALEEVSTDTDNTDDTVTTTDTAVQDNTGNSDLSSQTTTDVADNSATANAVTAATATDTSTTATTSSTSVTKPKKTSIKKVTSPKKKQIKVTWKKKSGVTGYQVQYATNKKFTKNKKTVTVKGASKTSKTIKKLKSKKTYYVRVRTYKTVNGKKVYSSWSTVKKVKVK